MEYAGFFNRSIRTQLAGVSLVALLNGCNIDTLPGQNKSVEPHPQPENTTIITAPVITKEQTGSQASEELPPVTNDEAQTGGQREIQKAVKSITSQDDQTGNSHHGKPKVVEPAGITSEELDRRLNEQSEQITKHIDNAFKNLSDEEKQALGFIKKELEAMKNKTWNDRFHDPDFWSAFIYAVLAAGQAVYFFRRQNKDAVRMEKITNEMYDATYQMRQNLEYLAAMIQVNRTTRALDRDKNIIRAERTGAFPEMYHYITQRIQNAQKLVVITMPFYQFGVVGNPHGLYDFHHTLRERFGDTARGDGPRLIFITYDDKSRYAIARKRYSRAIHAMGILEKTPQARKLKDIYSQSAWMNHEPGLDIFQNMLGADEEKREMLMQLAERQKQWAIADKDSFSIKIADFIKKDKITRKREISDKEAMDLMFIEEQLAEGSDERALFNALNDARDGFDMAAEAQEKIYFDPDIKWDGTGTPWPRGATIINVPYDKLSSEQRFDNEMTVCIDGLEIIRAYYSLVPFDTSRNNRLESQSGRVTMKDYRDFLTELFEVADRPRLKPEDLKRLQDILPGFQIVMPEPKA